VLRGAASLPPTQLIHLHRLDLLTVLVLGGRDAARREIAYRFHAASVVRRGPFVAVHCGRDEAQLQCALEAWTSGRSVSAISPLLAAERGTLFLDAIESLSSDLQRLLLVFVHRCIEPLPGETSAPWIGRLVAGNSELLSSAVARGRFLPALYDSIDKIRVDLPRAGRPIGEEWNERERDATTLVH
jgi:two-component system C4-dicarboxylate transport response regulator DctD